MQENKSHKALIQGEWESEEGKENVGKGGDEGVFFNCGFKGVPMINWWGLGKVVIE